MCVAHFFYEEKKEVRRWERESGGVGVDGECRQRLMSSRALKKERKKMYLK
jgi:hypothetical protein